MREVYNSFMEGGEGGPKVAQKPRVEAPRPQPRVEAPRVEVPRIEKQVSPPRPEQPRPQAAEAPTATRTAPISDAEAVAREQLRAESINQAVSRGIYTVTPGENWDPARESDYKKRISGNKIVYLDPETNREVGRMILKTDRYNPEKADDYTESVEGGWVVKRDKDGLEVARLPTMEGGASGPSTTIPEGYDRTQFGEYIEHAIQSLETSTGQRAISAELVEEWVSAIASYDVRGPMSVDQKEKLALEMEARLVLAGAEFRMQIGDYGGFDSLFSKMNSELFKHLREETLGIEGLNLIQKLEDRDGEFYRTNRSGSAREAALNTLAGGVGATVVKKDVVRRLMNTTLMSAFYSGPTDSSGKLLARKWQEEADAEGIKIEGVIADPRVVAAYPSMKYYRNENYWAAKWRSRIESGKRLLAIRNKTPKGAVEYTEDPFDNVDDPTGSGRKLIYYPEELELLAQAGLGGKASSLRYACETYATNLPEYNGVKTLLEFIKDEQFDPTTGASLGPAGVKYTRTSHYSGIVKGAGEVQGSYEKLIEDPIKNGERPGGKPDEYFAPMFDLLGKLTYLHKRAPNMVSFASKRAFSAVVDWNNSKNNDRFNVFRKNGEIKRPLIHAAIAALHQSLTVQDRKELSEKYGVSELAMGSKQAAEGMGGWGTDMGKLFANVLKSLGGIK